MPVIQREVSVPAGQTVSLFSGSTYEFARNRQVASIGVTAAATGTFVTINSGADVVAEEFPPVVATRFPIIPDEMYYNDILEAGDRLVVNARNPTGAAVIHRALAQLSSV